MTTAISMCSGVEAASGTLRAGNGNEAGGVPMVLDNLQVRRLTPRECERLQGFPDDHTLIQWRGKPAPDTLRYRAIGNSMAVKVMAWILGRVETALHTNDIEIGRAA